MRTFLKSQELLHRADELATLLHMGPVPALVEDHKPGPGDPSVEFLRAVLRHPPVVSPVDDERPGVNLAEPLADVIRRLALGNYPLQPLWGVTH